MPQSEDSYPLFRLINDAHTPAGDLYFGLISGFGDGLVVALIASLLMLFRLRLGMVALIAYLLSGLIAQIIKRTFDMPRPPALLENVHVLGHTLTAHSFPSGHSTSAGVLLLTVFLLWSLRDWRAWIGGMIFFSAAFGRIYGGVHFPIDVATGLAIGIATTWGLWRWSAGWPVARWQTSVWAWKAPAIIVAGEAAVLGLGYRMQPVTAQPLAFALAVAALLIMMQVWKSRSHG